MQGSYWNLLENFCNILQVFMNNVMLDENGRNLMPGVLLRSVAGVADSVENGPSQRIDARIFDQPI